MLNNLKIKNTYLGYLYIYKYFIINIFVGFIVSDIPILCVNITFHIRILYPIYILLYYFIYIF